MTLEITQSENVDTPGVWHIIFTFDNENRFRGSYDFAPWLVPCYSKDDVMNFISEYIDSIRITPTSTLLYNNPAKYKFKLRIVLHRDASFLNPLIERRLSLIRTQLSPYTLSKVKIVRCDHSENAHWLYITLLDRNNDPHRETRRNCEVCVAYIEHKFGGEKARQ